MEVDAGISLNKLIALCEGKRVRIAYNAHIPAIAFLFHHFIPQFIDEGKKLYFLVYSESLTRKLEVDYQSFFEDMTPEKQKVKQSLDDTLVIKVGSDDTIPFGQIDRFIHLTDLDSTMDEMIAMASSLDENALLVEYGLHLIPDIYGSKGLEKVFKFFESLERDLTFVSLVPLKMHSTYPYHGSFQDLYDVVIKVSTEEEFVAFGEETFLIGISHSYTPKIPLGYMRVIVTPDFKLKKIEGGGVL